MNNQTDKTYLLLTPFLGIISLLFMMTSCDFFEDELKQDQRLAYYRYHLCKVPDSLKISSKRVVAYKSIIEEASKDDYLITPRKKNKLLSEIYNVMSGECFDVKKMDTAMEYVTHAISLNAANQQAYYNRAFMYQSIGKDSLAIEDYGRAILNDEHYADAYYNRGIIYEKQTDFQLAVEDYSKAIALNPSYLIDVYNNRGNVYQVMEFYDKAIEDYNVALKIDSTKGTIYCNRADAYAHKGNFEKARQDFKKAYLKDSTNVAVIQHIKSLKQSMDGRKSGKKGSH